VNLFKKIQVLMLAGLSGLSGLAAQPEVSPGPLPGPHQGPQPGDIYREYAVDLRTGNYWRVTDPLSGQEVAHEFLPNPLLQLEIEAIIIRYGK
jgi:hypothetical protein